LAGFKGQKKVNVLPKTVDHQDIKIIEFHSLFAALQFFYKYCFVSTLLVTVEGKLLLQVKPKSPAYNMPLPNMTTVQAFQKADHSLGLVDVFSFFAAMTAPIQALKQQKKRATRLKSRSVAKTCVQIKVANAFAQIKAAKTEIEFFRILGLSESVDRLQMLEAYRRLQGFLNKSSHHPTDPSDVVKSIAATPAKKPPFTVLGRVPKPIQKIKKPSLSEALREAGGRYRDQLFTGGDAYYEWLRPHLISVDANIFCPYGNFKGVPYVKGIWDLDNQVALNSTYLMQDNKLYPNKVKFFSSLPEVLRFFYQYKMVAPLQVTKNFECLLTINPSHGDAYFHSIYGVYTVAEWLDSKRQTSIKLLNTFTFYNSLVWQIKVYNQDRQRHASLIYQIERIYAMLVSARSDFEICDVFHQLGNLNACPQGLQDLSLDVLDRYLGILYHLSSQKQSFVSRSPFIFTDKLPQLQPMHFAERMSLDGPKTRDFKGRYVLFTSKYHLQLAHGLIFKNHQEDMPYHILRIWHLTFYVLWLTRAQSKTIGCEQALLHVSRYFMPDSDCNKSKVLQRDWPLVEPKKALLDKTFHQDMLIQAEFVRRISRMVLRRIWDKFRFLHSMPYHTQGYIFKSGFYKIFNHESKALLFAYEHRLTFSMYIHADGRLFAVFSAQQAKSFTIPGLKKVSSQGLIGLKKLRFNPKLDKALLDQSVARMMGDRHYVAQQLLKAQNQQALQKAVKDIVRHDGAMQAGMWHRRPGLAQNPTPQGLVYHQHQGPRYSHGGGGG
jgi:hypothetical protein